jgi:hypothetical protein
VPRQQGRDHRPRPDRRGRARRAAEGRGRAARRSRSSCEPDDKERAAAILARFGEPCAAVQGVAVRLRTGEADLAEIVRALDAEGLRVENLQLHQPSLDDVFLAKTGRSLEGAGEEEEEPELALEPA